MRTKSRVLLVSFAAVFLVLLGGTLPLVRDPLPRMNARRSALAAVHKDSSFVEGGYVLTPVHLRATSGLAVDLLVRRAIADSGRLALAVVLGGHLTGREAARLVGSTPGVIVAAVSYPYDGDPRPHAAQLVRDIPRIRSAFLDTPPALMLALDYLLSRPDVDARNVEAIGVSLGAPFVCIAGALDKRFTRVWAIHGSGGSFAPLEANMRRTIPFTPLRVAAAAMANVIISGPRLDPVRWVQEIAPRPFVMVNAESDERLPRTAIDALYRSAKNPKELIWMSGAHVHGDAATIQRLQEIVLSRMVPAPSPAAE